MSRIEGSDDQRMREMNEAALRQKIDEEKRTRREKAETSFNQVISQKFKDREHKQSIQRHSGQDAQSSSERLRLKTQTEKPAQNTESQKRAALSSAMHSGNLATARGKLTDEAKRLENEHRNAVVEKGDEESERLARDVRSDELKDIRVTEERSTKDPLGFSSQAQELIGDDERQRGRRQHDDSKEQALESIAAVEAPRAAHVVTIPSEILAQIAHSVQVAAAKEGRTEVVIDLKGTLLEGIRLRVSAKRGKVQATFEGCDRSTKSLLEASRGELMRQLGKRGLELEIMRVK